MGRRDRVNGAEQLLVFITPSGIIDQPVDGRTDLFLRVLFGKILQHEFFHELGFSAFEQFRHAVQYLPAVKCRAPAPAAKCSPGRYHGIPEILSRTQAYVSQLFTRCINRGIITARFGPGELATDIEFICFKHLESFGRSFLLQPVLTDADPGFLYCFFHTILLATNNHEMSRNDRSHSF